MKAQPLAQRHVEREGVGPVKRRSEVGDRTERVGVDARQAGVEQAARAHADGVCDIAGVERLRVVCHEHLDGTQRVVPRVVPVCRATLAVERQGACEREGDRPFHRARLRRKGLLHAPPIAPIARSGVCAGLRSHHGEGSISRRAVALDRAGRVNGSRVTGPRADPGGCARAGERAGLQGSRHLSRSG